MIDKKIPNVRFKGFNDPWEQRKLSELGTHFSGLSGKNKDDFGHGTARYVTYRNVYANPFTSGRSLDAVEIDLKQTTVQYGDVFFTVSSETPNEVGMSSVWMKTIPDVYLNSFCFGFRPFSPTDAAALYYGVYFRSPYFRREIVKLAQGISRYNISAKKVLALQIDFPKSSEQVQIGQLFKLLGSSIASNQRKLDQLKTLKKLLLQKIFDQEWRFKGFTDPWEQRKLGQLVSIYSGNAPSQMIFNSYALIPYIKVDDLNNSQRYQRESRLLVIEDSRVDLVPANSVIFPKRGAAILNNKVRILTRPAYMDTNMMALEPIDIDAKFLYSSIYVVGLYKIADTSTIPQINNKHIIPYRLTVPKRIEQAKIGGSLETIDLLIASNQRKLDQLKQLKKWLLQNLFV